MGPWWDYAAGRELTGATRPTGPRPVTVADIRRRLNPGQSPFATDLNSRARADVATLTSVIDRARGAPTRLMNAPDLLSAVARYVPNAFGLGPAAAVDQVTRPAVNAFNANFGTHADYQPVTDQLLNAAGLLADGAEPRLPSMAREPPGAAPGFASVQQEAPQAARPPEPSPPIQPQARPVIDDWDSEPMIRRPSSPAPPRPPRPADRLADVPPHLTVVPDRRFTAALQRQAARLSELSPEQQQLFDDNARQPVIGPYLEDGGFPGHNGEALSRLRSTLADLSDHYWSQGAGGVQMADEIGRLSDNLMSTAARQQPEFAEALGGFPPRTAWREYPRDGSLTSDGQTRVTPGQGVMRAMNDNEPGPWRITIPRRALLEADRRMSVLANTYAPEDAPPTNAANDNSVPTSTLEAPWWAPSRRSSTDGEGGNGDAPTGPGAPPSGPTPPSP